MEDSAAIISEINRLKKEKNAIVMAHYYQREEVQDIADRIGDSLALAQFAAQTDADMIVMCGVHFMGETAKILCPDKRVVVPGGREAGCSLADSCEAGAFRKFVEEHPDHTVISYVNTSAAVKALTDIVVTSGNALKIVESLPADEKIIFGPDKNLGGYINSVTGRDMVLWPGACHVHDRFSLQAILDMKKQNPGAKILVHP
ncbi:MAG: quinolinate synthase NadA, partial [Muribaculaceae bacterium]|nr:quinolinate synthase NadA [Muribaculaceae bacterium]